LANGGDPTPVGTTRAETARQMQFALTENMQNVLASSAYNVLSSLAAGERPMPFDPSYIQEEAAELTARQLVQTIHGDSSHQEYLQTERDRIGRPTSIGNLQDGTTVNARAMSSFGDHRVRNNRLTSYV
jgi:hypothetical protein